MSNAVPAVLKDNQLSKFSVLLRNKWLYLLFIGIAGIALFMAFAFSSWNKTEFTYLNEDVVYSNEIHAVHEINPNNSQVTPNSAIVPSTDRPRIQLSDQYYDFGVINPTGVVTRTFVIANIGQTPLKIEHAYTTCGCTTANISSSLIPPGKVALMNIQFDPTFHNIQGSTVRRGVILETNDPEHPLQEIWIQATVR